MNLLAGIHTRWAADSDLLAAIPANRLLTGIYQAQEPLLPYCVLEQTGSVPSYTNDGASMETATVRFTIHNDQYDRGITILGELKRVFDRAHFSLGDNQTVRNMQRGDDSATQDPDGVWLIQIVFRCLVHLPAGA